MSDEAVLTRFSPLDSGVLADPYPVYRRLRAAGRPVRSGPGMWALGRYDDIDAMLRHPDLCKTLPTAYYEAVVGEEDLSRFLADMNLGRRDRFASRVLSRAVGPALLRALGGRMAELVEELLDPLLDGQPFDVVPDLALAFPLRVICQLLGVPDEDRNHIWEHGADLVRGFSDAPFLAERTQAAAAAALQWLRCYLAALLADRRRQPGTDALSMLASAEDDGRRLSDQEIVDNAIMVLYAGFETSAGLIANGISALLKNEQQFLKLCADTSLVPSAVEEVLRFEAPIQVTIRTALRPVEVAGGVIRTGRILLLVLGSANHDETIFASPDEFDVTRYPNPHLSFGGGAYHCLGSALARAEGAAVLDWLARRCQALVPAGDAQRAARFNFRTMERLPVRLKPR